MVKNLPAMWETQVQSLGRGNPMEKRMVVLVVKSLPVNAGDIRDAGLIPGSGRSLEEGMPTHFSILAWRRMCAECVLSPLKYPGKNSELSLTLDLLLYYNISRMILIKHESNWVIFLLKNFNGSPTA